MSYTPTKLYQGQLATAETTLFTATGNGAILKEVLVCNTDTAARTFSLSNVPSGGTAGTGNRLLATVSLSAGQTLIFSFSTVLNSGDFISGLASNGAVVNLTISGVAI